MKVKDETFQHYFYFIQERMNIFWKRYDGLQSNFTKDKILAQHKFTNVYRAQDRVSQYLINKVIYNQTEKFTEQDILLRILIFKIFNNIATWEFLERNVGTIRVSNFDTNRMSLLLKQRIIDQPIFNGAYMMTGSHHKYNMYSSKHEKWLKMVEHEFLKEKRVDKIIQAGSLEEIFNILSECSFLGGFLAYQYTVDFNYSEVINFDENNFVKAGIGSIRGIKKCFTQIGKYTFEDCIRYTQDNFSAYQVKYGFTEFKNLFGREPKLIDLQNCFCETDKYLRVKMPELVIDNTRIKQKFSAPKSAIDFLFPPKWGINDQIKQCTTKNSTELILF